MFWLAMGLVTVAVVLFSAFFISYLTTRHDVFLTNAEDLGIMDQAIWNTVHGRPLHQTICNIVNDTNCYSRDGIIRFAIHFEPILFVVSGLYALWPSPKTLFVVQTLVVAIGAYPAFWLARLRLRNELAAAGIALLYLLYPAQQQATVFDFHAVTFCASLLLFMLYFMYTRRTVWMVVFALLAMTCKEEIPLVVATYGLWSMVFQRRWRSGAALIVLGAAWFVMVFYVLMPHFSPTGHPLLEGRYQDLGKGPVQVVLNVLFHPLDIVRRYVLEPSHAFYLRILVSPAGYLPLLAPWVLVMAVPSIAINLFSSQAGMFTGLFQYNAEIVPVLIFATIEAVVLILWLVQVGLKRLRRSVTAGEAVSDEGRTVPSSWRPGRVVHVGLLSLLVVFTIAYALRVDYTFHGTMPFSIGFTWPSASPHSAYAQHFVDMVPAGVSVSAQTKLVPHLSQRENVYMFPYEDRQADYILLDVNGDFYPYINSSDYVREAKSVLMSGQYGVAAAQDGYLLLKRGLPPPSVSSILPGSSNVTDPLLSLPNLPESFCADKYVAPSRADHPISATFQATQGAIDLVGFATNAATAPHTFSRSGGYMSVTTYWRISEPIAEPMQIVFLLEDGGGKEYFASADMPSLLWCPMNTWKAGAVVQVTSNVFNLQKSGVPNGLAHMSVALLPLAQYSSTIMDMHARLPIRGITDPSIATFSQRNNALPLMQLNIVK